jgi:hypothetical protein
MTLTWRVSGTCSDGSSRDISDKGGHRTISTEHSASRLPSPPLCRGSDPRLLSGRCGPARSGRLGGYGRSQDLLGGMAGAQLGRQPYPRTSRRAPPSSRPARSTPHHRRRRLAAGRLDRRHGAPSRANSTAASTARSPATRRRPPARSATSASLLVAVGWVLVQPRGDRLQLAQAAQQLHPGLADGWGGVHADYDTHQLPFYDRAAAGPVSSRPAPRCAPDGPVSLATR